MATKKKKGGAKKGGRKSAKKATRKKTAKRGGAKRKPNAAFMKPMQPSAQLSAVVGSGAMPRTEVTKKLWAYIKRKGLQDAKERRMINADDNLRAVFGGKGKVSMFEMTKLVNKHLK
jgi:chromatin remodeling complex protein RSC6